MYTYDQETAFLQPEHIDEDPKRVNDRAPAKHWNVDVMTSAGEEQIRELVAYVCGVIAI